MNLVKLAQQKRERDDTDFLVELAQVDLYRIANHPKVRRRIKDDYGEFQVKDGWLYVGNEHGFAAFEPMNHVCYQIHIALTPELWGKGNEFCFEAIRWVFENTPCQKIQAFIPAYNRLAIRVAKLCMTQEGVLRQSFVRGFKLHDQIVFGITKEEGETICQH